ncbi:MAG: ABC transporter permease [Gemmatimonadota bacterium]|nr:ABC transporter permease [Gemmatimonadota bacterium]
MVRSGHAVKVILQRELAAYLKSPRGYVVAAALLLLAGVLFYAEALGPSAGERLSADVLARFFYNTSGLIAVAAVALSVRLFTDERQTGSMVLLVTAPVHEHQIVLGKFFGAAVFLTVLALATLYMPLLILVNGRVSWGHVAVGYLGLVLLGSAVLAIGIFASALTRNTLSAAVAGGVLVGTMFLFWPLSFVVDPPLSRVFAGLGLHGRHFNDFQTGVLHLRDVVYYLSVTYFFLLLATKTLQTRRWQ